MTIKGREAHYYKKLGSAYYWAGDFSGWYMTTRSTRDDDGLCGPFPSKEACQKAADERSQKEGLI